MKLKKGKKHNNKGFTLTEVLVALAVSSVVITIVIAFISQGSRFYKTQSNTINLQNELQETSNVITDTLQEATYLSITSNSKNLEVYTGSYEIKEEKKLFTSVKGSSRYILRDGTGIYVFDKADTQYITDKDKPGYRYSNNIEAITVSINEKCKTNVADSEVITQPVMLDVYIKVTHNDTSRFENKTITLRNKIQSLEVNGELYQIGSNGSQLVHVEK
ncbi:PilW family protein [Eshraghiella crossota]|uniref:PilW family protein n=1 Tax=Eshraghiella crossota TaxID=45851 RepID=UPI003AB29017